MPEKRNSKGTVAIREVKGMLRLAWTYQKRRYEFSLGLPAATEANLKVAQLRARQIELDMACDNFDPTLAKYKNAGRPQAMPVAELFAKFIDYKAKRLEQQSLNKYRSLLNLIGEFFGNKSADVPEREAEKFQAWLGDRMEPGTRRERVFLLKACWTWGMKRGLVAGNPWADMSVRVPKKKPANPFTKEEMVAIVQAFRTDPKHAHFADFVEFRFSTGARTGEAIALQWKHLNSDCSRIIIEESIAPDKSRKTTKTGEVRSFELTLRLQQMLLARRPENFDPEGIVFPGIRGGLIDCHNFNSRHWKPVLAELNIDYRRPYNMRHTMVSLALDAGLKPAAIAPLTGHSIRTLLDHYAGAVAPPKLPELF